MARTTSTSTSEPPTAPHSTGPRSKTRPQSSRSRQMAGSLRSMACQCRSSLRSQPMECSPPRLWFQTLANPWLTRFAEPVRVVSATPSSRAEVLPTSSASAQSRLASRPTASQRHPSRSSRARCSKVSRTRPRRLSSPSRAQPQRCSTRLPAAESISLPLTNAAISTSDSRRRLAPR